MDKQAGQNIQDAFLNTARRDKNIVTINFLQGGNNLSGRIKSFDKFSILIDVRGKEYLIFKHAISTVTVERRNPPHQSQQQPPQKQQQQQQNQQR